MKANPLPSAVGSTAPAHRDHDLAVYDLLGLAGPAAVTATLIRDARRSAGVGTAELARRVGVPEQVIALWEDPTWEGHSLCILRRVAKALELRLELRFTPARPRMAAVADEAIAA
jgi:DNA-binding transcriptional regulator YiaG